jgi:hypothetical protein
MVDIRLVRPRGGRIWVWTGSLAALALFALLLSMIFGDPTTLRRTQKRMAVFPTERAPVAPLRSVSFESVRPLEDRALGRLLHLSGTAQSGVARNAVWVKTDGGRRVLVRFEPEPPAGALRGIYAGGPVVVDGYLARIARAEFEGFTRSLGVVIPRPEPGVKFGDLPDSNFVRVDSLFVKDFYLSVRPDGIGPRAGAGAAPPPPPAGPPASVARPSPTPAQGTRTPAPAAVPVDSAAMPAAPPPDSTGAP